MPKPEKTFTKIEVFRLIKIFKRFPYYRARDKFLAVDSVSFTVDKGNVLGIVGANGAGKTTILHMILRLVGHTSGNIYIDGTDVGLSYGTSIPPKKTGVIFEDDGFYPQLSGPDNLKIYAKILGVKDSGKKINQLMADVRLPIDQKKPVGLYSRGMRQRLSIARVLLNEPDLFILDEPTAGLDAEEITYLVDKILKEQIDMKKTFIINSHEITDFVEKVCNRYIYLIDGKRVGSDLGEEKPAEGHLRETIVKIIKDYRLITAQSSAQKVSSWKRFLGKFKGGSNDRTGASGPV